MKPDRGSAFWMAVVAVAGIATGMLGAALWRGTRPAPIELERPAPTTTPAPTASPRPIRVHVSGQVVSPDVYELPPGSIVKQAVEAAGGFTEEADTAAVNLAQPLADGVQVDIPALEERSDEAEVVVKTPAPTGDQPEMTGGETTGRININLAQSEQLQSLPGIGPALAQRILDYRDAHGPFETVEAIMDVSGIGDAKFAQMQELITVDGE